MSRREAKVGKFKTVFRGVNYTIQQAKAELPNGRRVTFEVAIRPATVSVLPFDKQGRLVVLYEYRHGHKQFLWRLPTGRVRRGEDSREAAGRELREEAGFRARSLRHFFDSELSQALVWPHHYFLAFDLVADPLPPDSDEEIHVHHMPLEQAFSMVMNGKFRHEGMALAIVRAYALRRSIFAEARKSPS